MSPATRPLRQADRVDLQELLRAARTRGLDAPSDETAPASVDVTHVTHDSRLVRPGSLYCCVPGAVHDGHRFGSEAVEAGAVALLCERSLGTAATEIVVPSVRRAMGPVASALHGHPSDALDVVGVTGTNGKTTTVQLLAAVFEAAGRPCGLIGTLTGARTTPEAPDLQATLATMVADGCTTVAMEVSSHALDLHRVDGTRFRAAVFTNLSQDHLDHHGTMDAYLAAKARLFEADRSELAVINVDDERGRQLAGSLAIDVVPFSLDDAHDLQLRADGSSFRWRGQDVVLPLAGRFNVANALAAAATAAALGVDLASIARGLASVGRVDGRFERVDAGQPFLAAVDYAHTPDGLRQLLAAGRELATGRVIVVFGAGGDRDRGKRPEMGAAASALADAVILTTDNPRSEDPAAIMAAVQNGIAPTTDLLIEPDRTAAIRAGAAAARPGDVLLIAGKGHETTQTIGTTTTPFDDRSVLRTALAELGWTSGPETTP